MGASCAADGYPRRGAKAGGSVPVTGVTAMVIENQTGGEFVRRRFRGLVFALVALALVAAACGDSSGSSTGDTSSNATTTAGAAATTLKPAKIYTDPRGGIYTDF